MKKYRNDTLIQSSTRPLHMQPFRKRTSVEFAELADLVTVADSHLGRYSGRPMASKLVLNGRNDNF